MKKTIKRTVIISIAIIALIVLSSSFFTVGEYEAAIVRRFGSIHTVYVASSRDDLTTELAAGNFSGVKVDEGAGLKFKVPFVDEVIRYDTRLRIYDTPARQVIAADKKKLNFDNNAQWRITNPVLFNVSMNSISSAQQRIEDIMYSRMNQKVGKMQSHTLIADKEAVNAMLAALTSEVTKDLKGYGIEIFDIRIRRTDFPAENYDSIYNRMISERNKIAAQYRSEGEEEAIKVRSNTDKQVTIMLSEATAKAEQLRGEGDAEAARIYNEAYSKNPEFFEFYNTLETYKTTIGSNSSIILPITSPFAKYLTGEK